MSRESTKQALERYFDRQLKGESRAPKRKNKKPEKITEADCMKWLKKMRFSANIVESKAVYSASAGRYLNGQTDIGFSDIVANDLDGCALFIELKAKGKRSTLRAKQRIFLEEKIKTNCFAVVVDSADCLNECYRHWKQLWSRCAWKEAHKYLHSLLPKHGGSHCDKPLFGPDDRD